MEGYVLNQIGEEISFSINTNIEQLKLDFQNCPVCEYPICLIEKVIESYSNARFKSLSGDNGDVVIFFTI